MEITITNESIDGLVFGIQTVVYLSMVITGAWVFIFAILWVVDKIKGWFKK